jgi:hypothetical protein
MALRPRDHRRRRGRVLESWLLLFYVDLLMGLRGFPRFYALVRERQIRTVTQYENPNALSHAVDLACVFYFKPVLCLQRSAALVLLLSHHGWKSEMVIGAQLLPSSFHAWVEVEGVVVNDKPYVTETFQVLERC